MRFNDLRLLTLTCLCACTELPELRLGACGNHVLEVGEQCDGDPAPQACGAPTGPAACRFVCTGGAPCPGGMGCGRDLVCREASETFAPARLLAEVGGERLDVVDVDRDGWVDVAAFTDTAARVRFGSAEPVWTSGKAFIARTPTGPIVLDDVDGDPAGTLDLSYPSVGRVIVLLAQGRRSFASILTQYPIKNLPTGAPVGLYRGDVAFDGPFWLTSVGLTAGINFTTTVDYGARMNGKRVALPTRDWSAGQLVSDVRVGHLVPNLRGTRQALILAKGNQAAVYRWDKDEPSPGAMIQDKLELLPLVNFSGSLMDTPVFMDMNGDGRNDVLGVVGNPRPTLEVAETLATEPVTLSAPRTINAGVLALGEDGGSLRPITRPLAIALFDQDLAPDLILSSGAALSGNQSPLSSMIRYALVVEPKVEFLRAQIGDFNGDGAQDFVAEDGPDLVLYVNQNGNTFTRAQLDLSGNLQQFVAADVDGDGMSDLVIASGTSSTTLSVMYGSTSEPGQSLEVIGRIPKVLSFLSGDLFGELGGTRADGPGDLMVQLEPPSGDGALFVLLNGSPSRQLLSGLNITPLDPGSYAGADGSVTRSVTAGRFCPSQARRTVVAHLSFGADEERLALARAIGPVNSHETWLSTVLSAAGGGLIQRADFDAKCAHWSAADLDGDGKDELVGVERAQAGCAGGAVITVSFDASDCHPTLVHTPRRAELTASRVKVSPLIGRPAVWAWTADRLRVFGFEGGRASVPLVDVDLKQTVDAAPLPSGAGIVAIAEGKLILRRSDAAYATSEVLGALPRDELPTGLAIADVDLDGIVDLIVLTDANTYVFEGLEKVTP